MSAPFQISPQPCVTVLIYHSLGCSVPNTCFVMMPVSSKQLLFSLHLQRLKSTDSVCYYSHVLTERHGRQRRRKKKPRSLNSPLLPSLKSSFHTTAQSLHCTLISPNKNPDCIIYTLCLYSLTNCERTGSRVSQAAPAAA